MKIPSSATSCPNSAFETFPSAIWEKKDRKTFWCRKPAKQNIQTV